MSHPVLSRLATPALAYELSACKRLLEERLDRAVRHLAYPFGKVEDYGIRTTGMLAKLGFRSAVTTVWGINTPAVDRFQLRRVQIGEGHSLALFACKLTQLLLEGGQEKDLREEREELPASAGPEVFHA